MNLAHAARRQARPSDPERPALLFEDDAISYGELDRQAAVAAGALHEAGVRAGDRVAVKLPNTPAYVAAYFGVLRLGAIVVPLNILLARPEIEARVEAASAKTSSLIARCRLDGEPLPEIAERDDDDPAALLFTSGTTGLPKAAILTHGEHPRSDQLRRGRARRSPRTTSCSAPRPSRTCSVSR